MKAHTNDFKNEIKLLGRELDSKITINGEVLTGEHINSISLHYEGAILKSVMKQLDLDIDRDIPVNTILNAQFGVKVNGAYEYLNLGNFVVYKAEKQEDTNSYKITCYDKLLYSMKEYETTGTYPITIRDYIKAICTQLGLEFANEDDDFTNYDKVIQDELYFDEDGNSLGYTYRDVLDELAEVTASTICINNDDKLEIRYVNNTGEYLEVEGTNLQINSRDTNDFDLQLEGDTYQYTTTGKNLSPINSFTLVKGTNRTTSINFPIPLPAGQYTISWKIKSQSGFSTSAGMGWAYYDSSTSPATNRGAITPLRSNSPTTGSYTRTLDGPTTHIYVYIDNSLADSATITLEDIQLEVGATATSYEPYTGNNPSPSPDYPQDIEVVTGRQEIQVGGKNYIDGKQTPSDIPGELTITKNDDGSYTVNGTISSTKYTTIVDQYDLKIPVGNYVLSIKDSNGNTYRGDTYYYYGTTQNYKFKTFNDQTYTFEKEVNRFRITLYITAGTYSNVKVYFQLEKGNTSSSYEKYIPSNFYEINLGKNLFNPSVINGSPSVTIEDDGTIVIPSRPTVSNGYYATGKKLKEICPSLKIGETYYIYVDTDFYVDGGPNKKDWIYIGENWKSGYSKTITQALLDQNVIIYGGYTEPTHLKIMVTKENDTNYAKYFTPIELAKIDTYKDRIFKTEGKNLCEPQGHLAVASANYITAGSTIITSPYTTVTNYRGVSFIAKVEAGKTYVISSDISLTSKYRVGIYNSLDEVGVGSNIVENIINVTSTFTPTHSGYAVIGKVADNSGTTITWSYIQVELGTQITSFEPYGESAWYIEEKIGKVAYNGASIVDVTSSGVTYKGIYNNNATPNKINEANKGVYYERARFVGAGTKYENTIYENRPNVVIVGSPTDTLQSLKDKFNGGKLLYVYATPTYTKITNIELISQLESIRLLEGVNNISVGSGNLSSPIKLSYLASRDTIDEEYLKDVNVNFGEMYGPVNTIALTRAETDTIAQSYPSDLPDEDKIAIEIKDNQIMNFNDRDTYLTEILKRLEGLKYYLNDFASTGIVYYDICDKYDVSIDGKLYDCLMLNDEVNITQGLEENIYTDMPEEAEVEYKYTTTTDKAIREASIIIDKKISQVDIKGKTINLTADDISIASNNFNVDVNGNVSCSNATISGEITASSGAIGGYEITKSPSGTNYIKASAYPKYNFDINDYLKVKSYLDGTGTLTPMEELMYDIDGDGQVTEIDMQFIYRMVELQIDTGQGIHVQLTSNPNDLNMNGFSVIAGYMTVFNASPMWGVTVNNGRIWGERVLFEDNSTYGETGTVTLVDQIDDDLGLIFDLTSYKYIEIFGVDNNGTPGAYIKVQGVILSGDEVTIQTTEAGANGTYIRKTKYTSTNDNQLVPSNYGYIYINNNGSVQTNSSRNYIGIKKVVGYK